MLLKYTSIIYTDYTSNVQNGIDKSLDQYRASSQFQGICINSWSIFQVICILPDYIDLKTCQYHYVHFRYNLYKLVKYISGNMYITRFFSA